MDKLSELISSGPDARYTIKSVVLSRYDDIVQARSLMHTWASIAEALGMSGRGKDLSACFLRVDKGVKSGALKPNKQARSARPARPLQRIQVDTEPDDILSRIPHI